MNQDEDVTQRSVAKLAHEFNNVLMGIQPFVEVLRRLTTDIPKAQEATGRIAESVKRGKQITNEILRHTPDAEPLPAVVTVMALIDALPANIALLDGNGIVTAVNAAWRQFADANTTGPRIPDIGRDYLAICANAIGPDASDIHAIGEGILAVLRGANASFSTEYACHSPAERRWFAMTVTPIGSSGEGALVRYLDITSRKQAEEANERALERLNEAQRVACMGDWDFTIAGQIITWSPQVYELLGRDPQLGPPRDVEEHATYYTPASREVIAKAIRLAIATGLRQEHDLTTNRADGRDLHVHAVAVPVRDENGNVTRIHGTVQDITARKVALADLQERERELKETQRLAGLGSWYSDFATGSNRWSDETSRIYGLDPASPTPSYDDMAKIVTAESFAKMAAATQRMHETGAGSDLELELVRPDGSHGWVLSSAAPVYDAEGRLCAAHGTALDITERKRSELAFAELSDRTERRERMLSILLTSMNDFAYIFDRDGRFLFANQRLLDLLGITLDGIVGKNFFDLGYPVDLAERLQRQIQEVLTTRKVVRDETKFVAVDGRDGYYEYVFSPVMAADSSAEFVVGSTRDITERKSVEFELRDRDEKFNQLANNINDAFWIRSADMTELHYLSPAFERIWGRSADSLKSDPLVWASYIVEEDRKRVEEAYVALTRHEKAIDEEYRILRPDGEMRWVRSRGFQVHDDEGNHIRNSGIVTDTTARRSAEEELRRSQKQMRDVFDGLGPSLFVGLLTAEGIVVEINRSPLEEAGLEASDVIGRHFAETYWWSHSAEERRMLREAITRAAAGKASRFDVRARGAGDAMIDVDFSLQPLRDESGRVAFLIPSGNVITERKVAEEALRQAQKMEAVGQLAAGVAHEFNNLMQALMSMSTMMRLRAIDRESAKIGTDIESLLKRGAGLTQQLLLFSRYRPIEKSALDLGVEVQKASELLRHLIPATINIVVDITDAPLHAQGDAGQMQQVLLNLAINARDAMPDGGTLTLRAGRAGRDVFHEVEDTGLGMDAETRHHLFEPFFTTKGPAKGTGLGLAVAHGIVEQHGGRIEVHTTLGDGSRFRVLLPEATLESTPAVAARAGEIAPGGGKQLLLLEDDASVREGLSALLEWVGYNVVTASNGEEALALVMDPPPALLLSDVTLPGIGGPATAKRLRERWPELKVVMMSGYADDAMRATASGEGWHFLQKPFEFADLERMLRVALLEIAA